MLYYPLQDGSLARLELRQRVRGRKARVCVNMYCEMRNKNAWGEDVIVTCGQIYMSDVACVA